MLREADDRKASEAVAALLGAGASPRIVWDAALLMGVELSHRHADLGAAIFPAFHTITGVNALHRIAAATHEEDTKRVAIFQAAVLATTNARECARRRVGLEKAIRVHAMTPVEIDSLNDVFANAKSDRARAFRVVSTIMVASALRYSRSNDEGSGKRPRKNRVSAGP